MKTFKVENTKRFETIKVTLHNPPYDDEYILAYTKWKTKDCIITEMRSNNDGDLDNPSRMDHEIGEEDDSNKR